MVLWYGNCQENNCHDCTTNPGVEQPDLFETSREDAYQVVARLTFPTSVS